MSAVSILIRANITEAELKTLRLGAVRADKRQGDYNAEVIRAGLRALNGKGEK
jgi:hypothetical protein